MDMLGLWTSMPRSFSTSLHEVFLTTALIVWPPEFAGRGVFYPQLAASGSRKIGEHAASFRVQHHGNQERADLLRKFGIAAFPRFTINLPDQDLVTIAYGLNGQPPAFAREGGEVGMGRVAIRLRPGFGIDVDMNPRR